MKIILTLIFALSLLATASEKYGVYDLQGNRVSTFEAEWFDVPEKTKQAKQKNPHKTLYVSSLKKGKGSKPASRYRYKAETGAYIEASRKETFSVCPEKEIEGIWISEHSVYLNEANCLSIQAPNLAGTFRILFLQNSGLTDTIRVLVDQSYIQMGDYSHKVWVTDLEYYKGYIADDLLVIYAPFLDSEKTGYYKNRAYSQPLIVDKTKFTMRDAWHFSKGGNYIEFSPFDLDEYPKNERFEESMLPLIGRGGVDWRLANERSKKEDLDTAYRMVDTRNNVENLEKLILLGDPNPGYYTPHTFLALDTSASGYRSPFDEEWFFLMRAGASTRYYWGDEEDLKTVSRYEWVNPVGLKPVAKKQPNGFGLYDIIGIAKEKVRYFNRNGYWDSMSSSCNSNLIPECSFIRKLGPLEEYMEPAKTIRKFEIKSGEAIYTDVYYPSKLTTRPVTYEGYRLLRKTPKLHKLEKL